MKKLRKDNVAIIIALVLVLIYVSYEVYSVTHIDLVTQTAVTSTVYEKIDADALVVRQEQVVTNASDGVTVASDDSGAKIKKDGKVGYVFSSQDEASNYLKYLSAKKELEYYENLQSQTVGQAANVESLNENIDECLNDYIRSLRTNTDISAASSDLNGNLIKRQLIIGESINFTPIISELQSKIESYSVSQPIRSIKTNSSGIFSTYTDGYEGTFDYSKVTDMSPKQVTSAIKKIRKTSDTGSTSKNLGKLVTAYNWYMLAVVDGDSVKSLADGQTVSVALKEDNSTVDMKIVSGAELTPGSKQTVLVLESDDMNDKIAALRSSEIEIRYKSYTGIKVPTEALHVYKGKKGVYALISSQVKFREADVIFTDDDYVLLSYDPENEKGIRLYDKIITQGKDLDDGKVYT